MLALDLLVLHRDAKPVPFREAVVWSVVWVTLALGFGAFVAVTRGSTAGGEYLAGYLIELSLSVDNVFVFSLLFAAFAVPAAYQHRLLFWGILGAIVFRAAFIAAGTATLVAAHWVIYLLGAFLVITGIRLARSSGHAVEPEKNPALRLFRRVVPMTRGLPRRRLHRPRARSTARDAVAGRARRGRDHRHHVRARLDPGGVRGHDRSVHRLRLEPVRDPRPARALLPARGPSRPLCLSQDRACSPAGVRRSQDPARRGARRDPDCDVPGGHRPHPRDRDRCIAGRHPPAKGGARHGTRPHRLRRGHGPRRSRVLRGHRRRPRRRTVGLPVAVGALLAGAVVAAVSGVIALTPHVSARRSWTGVRLGIASLCRRRGSRVSR